MLAYSYLPWRKVVINRLERNQEREKEVTDLEYLKNVTLKVSINKNVFQLQVQLARSYFCLLYSLWVICYFEAEIFIEPPIN